MVPAARVTIPSAGTATQLVPSKYSSVPMSPASVSPALRVSLTVVAVSAAADKLTVNSAVLPSLRVPALVIETDGRSSSGFGPGPVPSSTMVVVALPLLPTAALPPLTLLILIVKSSAPS